MAKVDLNLSGVNDLVDGLPKISKGAELLGARLERLLFTSIGGYLGRPEDGSIIPQYFFNQNSEVDVLDLIAEVQDIVVNNEPNIVLTELSAQIIAMSPEKSGLVISIKGLLDVTRENFSVEFFKIKEKNNTISASI